MSWWDTKGFSSLASQALKTAQKQIDKVLDIDDASASSRSREAVKTSSSAPASNVSSPESNAVRDEQNSWDSWSSWMTSKPQGGENKKEEDEKASSSWNVSWGGAEASDPKYDESALSSIAEEVTPVTVQASSAADTSRSSGTAKQKSSFAYRDKKARVLETEFSEIEKSKEKEENVDTRLSSEQTVDSHDKWFRVVMDETVQETMTHRCSTPRQDDMSSLGKELNSGDTQTEQAEEQLSEAVGSDSVPLIAEAEDPPSLSASGINQISNLAMSEKTITFPAASDIVQQTTCDEIQGETFIEPVSPAGSVSLDLLTAEQADVGYARDDLCASECSASHTTSFMDRILETLPQKSSSSDALEFYDAVVSGSSSDTLVSGEASFTKISSSEDFQIMSVTSMSSEPILLSYMTTEDCNTIPAQEEEELPDRETFSPQSHSSEMTEAESERTSPTEAVLSQNASSAQLDSTVTVSSNESSETSRLDSSVDTVIDNSQLMNDEAECEELDVKDDSDRHWLENSGLAGMAASTSPSASFVKCMIEDAMGMEDASKLEDSGSDNHSEEKSESSKLDSEFEKSIYSGHDSSDDIETTTSSDIEIISTPTSNGEKILVDLSPLKFSLQKAARAHNQSHQRSDSQSSSSTHSKGDGDQLSPERDCDHGHHSWHQEGKGTKQQDTAAQDTDLDNPQHPHRLLKSCKNQQDRDVVKKLAETAEVLQARESKLVQLSKDNNDLLEANSILRSQLQQAEEAREAEMTDLNALTEEFTRRMGESERKIQAILKEKETLKQQLQLTQNELAKKSEDTNLAAVLSEKDEQLEQLIFEGEKLSKQQLQNSNIIKKLRSKEKENEGLIASQKKKLDQQKEELERLKIALDAKEDMEKKQADAIKQLNAAVQMIEKEKIKLKMDVDSSEEKIRGLQATLDNSYKEIAELHKSNASQDSRAQQAALSAEMQVREELKMAMEQQKQQFLQEREALTMQIGDLRMSLARMEKEHNRREEILKQEISDLHMRLQEDESRNQDLTHSVTSATRPLLRQIENLQATNSIQASAWEKVERNLAERLTEAQTLLALAQEKERTASEKLSEISSRCFALEASNSQLRKEKAELAARQESDRLRIEALEERRASDVTQLELTKQKLSEEVASIRKDKVFLESQLETERNRLEVERRRVAVAEEQIHILERERPRSRGTPSPVSVSRQESMNSSFSEQSSAVTWLHKSEEGEGHFMMAPAPKTSLYDSIRNSGAATLTENLQAQLKLREGEILQLQAEIQQLERTRESMARELVNLTNENEELKDQVSELPNVRTELKELDARYNALLQMYGEKEERVQELLMDLEDVKDMYKQQINSLMQ